MSSRGLRRHYVYGLYVHLCVRVAGVLFNRLAVDLEPFKNYATLWGGILTPFPCVTHCYIWQYPYKSSHTEYNRPVSAANLTRICNTYFITVKWRIAYCNVRGINSNVQFELRVRRKCGMLTTFESFLASNRKQDSALVSSPTRTCRL